MAKEIKKMRTAKPATQNPQPPEFKRPISLETDNLFVVGDLVSVARGAGLVLNATQENVNDYCFGTIAMGLSQALLALADKVDVDFFQCLGSIAGDAGELSSGLADEKLGYLLQEELSKVRDRIQKRGRGLEERK
jgi:hypothetical protein